MTVQGRQIDTKNTLAFFSAVLAAWLLYAGIYNPDAFLMSFTNEGTHQTILRTIALIGMTVIIVSRPPRSTGVRMALGAMSSVVLMGACISMMDFHIGVLDAALYLLVSIILAMEAIEDKKPVIAFAETRQLN